MSCSASFRHWLSHCEQIPQRTNKVLLLLEESVNCSVMSDSLPPHGYSSPGSSVLGILQARILEWVAIPFSRGSSQPRDQIQVSPIAGRFFTFWATISPLRGEIYKKIDISKLCVYIYVHTHKLYTAYHKVRRWYTWSKKCWIEGHEMPRGSEVAVINMMVKKGFTKNVTFEQAPENILEKKHSRQTNSKSKSSEQDCTWCVWGIAWSPVWPR